MRFHDADSIVMILVRVKSTAAIKKSSEKGILMLNRNAGNANIGLSR